MVGKLFILVLLLDLVYVRAWGEEGHKIIADIALQMLTSTALGISKVYTGSKTLYDIAPLPDTYDHTSKGSWSSPCHYVNLDKDELYFNETRDCPSFCVVKSIQNYTAILSEGNSPKPCNYESSVEPCALEFLVHFAGDVHQPLHVSYAVDRGGNEVKVEFFSEKMNLHEVWDTGILTHWHKEWKTAAKALQAIIKKEPDVVKQYLSVTDPKLWANESFQFVRNTVYNFTIPADGVPKLGEKYYHANLPVVQQRLIAGGVRLGLLLNTILVSHTKGIGKAKRIML